MVKVVEGIKDEKMINKVTKTKSIPFLFIGYQSNFYTTIFCSNGVVQLDGQGIDLCLMRELKKNTIHNITENICRSFT